jgi:hypothetical protein
MDTLQEPNIAPAFHAAVDAQPVGRRQAIDGMRVIRARRAEVFGWLWVGRSCANSVIAASG